MPKYFSTLLNKSHHFYLNAYNLVLKCVCRRPPMATLLRFFITRVNSFWLHLSYFLVVSLVGFLALKMTKTRSSASYKPDDLDLFFTSVSASTLSSMSVVEMEVFSTSQLVIMTILMFIGGEVFISMFALLLRGQLKSFLDQLGGDDSSPSNQIDQLELGSNHNVQVPMNSIPNNNMKYQAIKTLAHVMLGYLVTFNLLGSSLVILYISTSSSASNTLKSKGLNLPVFSVFLIVSTFTNCGYVPTNENMMAFKQNTGLLLILLPQILFGNTLFPCGLRLVISLLEKTQKHEEYTYMLNNHKKLGFSHLFSTFNSCMLTATALGFVVLQFVLFCIMEWRSEGLKGLNSYEKFVGSLFQAANARHSGESIVDLSTISSAIIVLFVVMMYLPPYTMFIPTWRNQEKGMIKDENEDQSITTTKLQRKSKVLHLMNMIFCPLSTLFISTLLICVTERESLRDDPLNFNVLNIVVEVVSAYGNVGYSMGYSCERRLNVDERCKDMWYGFSGRWSKKGKLVLIAVMVYGRLKKFNLQGGQGWNLT